MFGFGLETIEFFSGFVATNEAGNTTLKTSCVRKVVQNEPGPQTSVYSGESQSSCTVVSHEITFPEFRTGQFDAQRRSEVKRVLPGPPAEPRLAPELLRSTCVML